MLFSQAAAHTPEAGSLKVLGVAAAYTPEACILQAVVPHTPGIVARVDDPAISPVQVLTPVWTPESAAETVIPPVFRKPRKMTPLRRFYCHNNNKT